MKGNAEEKPDETTTTTQECARISSKLLTTNLFFFVFFFNFAAATFSVATFSMTCRADFNFFLSVTKTLNEAVGEGQWIETRTNSSAGRESERERENGSLQK